MAWLRRYAFALACWAAVALFVVLMIFSSNIEQGIYLAGGLLCAAAAGGAVVSEYVFGGLHNNLQAMKVLGTLLKHLSDDKAFDFCGRVWAPVLLPPRMPKDRAEPAEVDAHLAAMRAAVGVAEKGNEP